MNRSRRTIASVALMAVAGVLALTGCSDDGPLIPEDRDVASSADRVPTLYPPPPGLVSVSVPDGALTFWPYTGRGFDGTPVDPINLIFAGEADPVRIRAALLGLDGDRTAFGFPDAYPFNVIWEDAMGGDVQTTYAEDGTGWSGSVIQLQLGSYGPARVHLRLFSTDERLDGTARVTLGGAHFEILIPGTADHQVISWEVAEAVVVADMVRCGLLDPASPIAPTGLINAAPSFRDIPAVIYNGLPPELIGMIGGPPPPVSDPVPLASDGQGTVVFIAEAAAITPESISRSQTLTYDQFIPKPFCSAGPQDWLHVSGPVDFSLELTVTPRGNYTYEGGYRGALEATPVDMSTGSPVPVGGPFPVSVDGSQHGWQHRSAFFVVSSDSRVANQPAGTEYQTLRIKVSTRGRNGFRLNTQCLEDAARSADDRDRSSTVHGPTGPGR